MVGFIHNHPSGNAPSPSDIFNASIDIMSALVDTTITPDQLTLYLNNYISLIVSGDYVYSITVKDAQLFAYMTRELEGQQQAKENNRYRASVTKYLNDNNIDGSDKLQLQTAGESALLKLFNGMFNLNKQKIDETENNKAVKRSSDGKISITAPCTP